MNKNSLADFFENVGEMFEKFNPAAFRFLAAILPYSTPFPVAWLTMRSAETFLGFEPFVAFIFVFGLEGMGLWFTSLFVDSVIDFILSRNAKSFILVALFGVVVIAYVYLLVSLNVTLEASRGESSPALQQVITLLCFLPLLTGVGNGYYKWKLEQASKLTINTAKEEETAEKIRKEKSEERLKVKMIKAGMNPTAVQYQQMVDTVRPTTVRKSDWRQLTTQEQYDAVYVHNVPKLLELYSISRSTAFSWKSKKV